jgi:hypothetical protein
VADLVLVRCVGAFVCSRCLPSFQNSLQLFLVVARFLLRLFWGAAADARLSLDAPLWFSLRHALSFGWRSFQSSGSMLGMQRRVLSSASVGPRFFSVQRETPNQAMQPTAGRREANFPMTQPLPFQPTRALASGG